MPISKLSSFSESRQQQFSDDADRIRRLFKYRHFHTIMADHGYNATPLWTALGGSLTSQLALERGGLRLLALLDPLLLIAMWCGVLWAFGWRALCAGLLFWGTNAFGLPPPPPPPPPLMNGSRLLKPLIMLPQSMP